MEPFIKIRNGKQEIDIRRKYTFINVEYENKEIAIRDIGYNTQVDRNFQTPFTVFIKLGNGKQETGIKRKSVFINVEYGNEETALHTDSALSRTLCSSASTRLLRTTRGTARLRLN